MRKLLLVAGACMTMACGDSMAPENGVVLTGTISTPAIQARQSVAITLTVRNYGAEEVSVNLSDCNRPFDVLNTKGAVVGPGSVQVCSLALVAPTKVPPGGSVTYETAWDGDASGLGPADERLYLSPGTYFIRPRIQVTEGGFSIYGTALAITIKP
jgi:hypothetical protein